MHRDRVVEYEGKRAGYLGKAYWSILGGHSSWLICFFLVVSFLSYEYVRYLIHVLTRRRGGRIIKSFAVLRHDR